eukprot:7592-Heterococcus_DN1.PRE.1
MSLFKAFTVAKTRCVLHYLNIVLVSSSTTACTVLDFAFNICQYRTEVSASNAEVSGPPTNAVYSYRHVAVRSFDSSLNEVQTQMWLHCVRNLSSCCLSCLACLSIACTIASLEHVVIVQDVGADQRNATGCA